MFIAFDEPDIIMITEVIPKAQKHPIADSQLEINGYNVYTNFSNTESNLGSSGIRGVAIYIKNDIMCKEVTILGTDEYKDQIWIEITLFNEDKLLCGCIYRSPAKEKDVASEDTKYICDLIKKAMELLIY